jgi:hypothetical protein
VLFNPNDWKTTIDKDSYELCAEEFSIKLLSEKYFGPKEKLIVVE